MTEDGIFLEQLETNPAKYLPDVSSDSLGGDVLKVSKWPMSNVITILRGKTAFRFNEHK